MTAGGWVAILRFAASELARMHERLDILGNAPRIDNRGTRLRLGDQLPG